MAACTALWVAVAAAVFYACTASVVPFTQHWDVKGTPGSLDLLPDVPGSPNLRLSVLAGGSPRIGFSDVSNDTFNNGAFYGVDLYRDFPADTKGISISTSDNVSELGELTSVLATVDKTFQLRQATFVSIDEPPANTGDSPLRIQLVLLVSSDQRPAILLYVPDLTATQTASVITQLDGEIRNEITLAGDEWSGGSNLGPPAEWGFTWSSSGSLVLPPPDDPNKLLWPGCTTVDVQLVQPVSHGLVTLDVSQLNLSAVWLQRELGELLIRDSTESTWLARGVQSGQAAAPSLSLTSGGLGTLSALRSVCVRSDADVLARANKEIGPYSPTFDAQSVLVVEFVSSLLSHAVNQHLYVAGKSGELAMAVAVGGVFDNQTLSVQPKVVLTNTCGGRSTVNVAGAYKRNVVLPLNDANSLMDLRPDDEPELLQKAGFCPLRCNACETLVDGVCQSACTDRESTCASYNGKAYCVACRVFRIAKDVNNPLSPGGSYCCRNKPGARNLFETAGCEPTPGGSTCTASSQYVDEDGSPVKYKLQPGDVCSSIQNLLGAGAACPVETGPGGGKVCKGLDVSSGGGGGGDEPTPPATPPGHGPNYSPPTPPPGPPATPLPGAPDA